MSVLPANIPKRGLSKKEAAEYCGLSVHAFENKVQSFQFPSALKGTKCWDRHALDAALDRLSGLDVAASSSSALDEWRSQHG